MVKDVVPVTLGFALGGLSYSVANHILNKKSRTRHRKQSHGDNAGGGKDASGKALLIGSLMDSREHGIMNIISDFWRNKHRSNSCNIYL